jgi:hypothetical protein
MALPKTANKNSFIPSGKNEYVKQYIVYDGSSRMTHLYEGPANMVHGDACMLTEYAYDGAGTDITKRKESESTWDSSYDI